MIQISQLESGYGGRALFRDMTMNLTPGNRYGIVGANGAGKSTLLKIVTNELAPVSGQLTIANDQKVGHLEQDQFQYDHMNIQDVALNGNTRLFNALNEKKLLLSKGSNITAEEGQCLAELEMVIDEEDGYQAEAETAEILHGLGFAGDVSQIKMKQLSGGYKVRVFLAKCLFSKPDIMLLDEPTNNLDLYSIIWLEKFLREFSGLLLFISHDRRFLNSVATHIIDIDYQEAILYKGDFNSFLEQKEMAGELRGKEQKKQEKEIAEMKKFIDRFGAKATKARQANSRKKQIERLKPVELKLSSRISPKFRFNVKAKSGKEVLKVKHLSKSFNDKQVLNRVSFNIERGQKIGVIGINGVGKSTLLKILTGNLRQDSGEIEPGYALSMGYFSQNHKDLLPDNSTPYKWLYESAPSETESRVRSLLGSILLSGDDIHKKIGSLSGGEATRLIISRIMYRQDNLLVLDEPTNHMDMETAEAFLGALKKYEGTIIFVSHDRYFTNNLADHILELTPAGYELFSGTYSEYAQKKNIDLFEAVSKPSENTTDKSVSKSNTEYILSRKELSRNEHKNKQTEDKIVLCERSIEKLQKDLSDPSLYAEVNNNQLSGLQNKLAKEEKELTELMELWENQQKNIHRLKQSLES